MKSKTRKLPPHSWEPHHLADHAEANKQLIITIVSVAAIVILALAIFLAKESITAGKAISFGQSTQVGVAGIFVSGGSVTPNTEFTVPVTVKLPAGKKSVAVEFTINYDYALTPKCDDSVFKNLDTNFVVDSQPLYVLRTIDCSQNSKIKITYTGLCSDASCSNALKDTVTLAEIGFTSPAEEKTYVVGLESAVVLDLDTGMNLVTGTAQTVGLKVETPKADVCTDDDKGDISLKGTVSLADGTMEVESCYDPSTVRELTCSADNQKFVATLIKCPSGTTCLDGACKPESNCKDTDGGLNYGVPGSLSWEGEDWGNYLDYCIENILFETTCEGVTADNFFNNVGLVKEYDCASEGNVCKEGACAPLSGIPVCGAITLLEGEIKIIAINDKKYTVSLASVDRGSAQFSVNGEKLSKLGKDESGVLTDGAILTVTNIVYQAYAGGVHSASFTLYDPTNNVCGEGYVCSDGTCIAPTACSTTNLAGCTTEAECTTINGLWKDGICTIKPITVSPLEIEVWDGGTLKPAGTTAGTLNTLSADATYKVKIKIAATTAAIPESLILAQVFIDGGSASFHAWPAQPVLAVGGKKEVEFTYPLLKGKTNSKMTIKAYVWNGWLSESTAYSDLVDSAKVEYSIS